MSPRAVLWDKFRKEYADGTFVELAIWLVPISKDHPHGLKYRLHFGDTAGNFFLRYDNEKGKGDHSHIGMKEKPYVFITTEKLLEDFWNDVAAYRKKLI